MCYVMNVDEINMKRKKSGRMIKKKVLWSIRICLVK